jgi:hypothetical protein
MPGTFALADRAGPKSHLFQPPRSPSASSSVYLSRSSASISMLSDRSDRPTFTSRKRSRQDYSVEDITTPVSVMPDWLNGMDTSDTMARSESMDPGSPIPFVNTRYQLAGGLDTPTAAAAAAQDIERSEYADAGYRKRLSDGASITFENGYSPYFPQTPAPQFTDANGRARANSYESQSAGWSKLAIEVVGSVVGKVWEFCKAGAFRGFTAGGGKAYGIQRSQPHTPQESNFRPEETESTMFGGGLDRESTPIPGQFIEDDYISDYIDRRTLESTPPRASKRLHLSNDDGELERNWIMVSSEKTTNLATPQSRSKPVARYSMPTASSAGRRLTATTTTHPTASRANSRRPLLHGTRPSAVSHAGSPGLHATRPASFASPRSPGGSRLPMPSTNHNYPKQNFSGLNAGNSAASPASIEAQRYVARIKKEEQEADESIRRFNAQLQAMIREGKEALGTRIEVDEVDELVMEELLDDGFE